MKTITFDRTCEALAAYDAHDATLDVLINTEPGADPMRRFATWQDELNRLARVVGRTFGEETNHVNSPDVCETCVHPSKWLRDKIAKPLVVTDEQLAECEARRDHLQDIIDNPYVLPKHAPDFTKPYNWPKLGTVKVWP
jgi:hypothetical protein